MSYMIGIDVGTSGVKTLVISETGEIVTQATAEYPCITRQGGQSIQRTGGRNTDNSQEGAQDLVPRRQR